MLDHDDWEPTRFERHVLTGVLWVAIVSAATGVIGVFAMAIAGVVMGLDALAGWLL